MPHPLPSRVLAAAAVSAALLLSGCQSIEGTTAGSATVRFVDVSSDSPGMDFYLNKQAQAYNLGYETSTNAIPVSAGNYAVSVNKYSTTQQLASTTLSVVSGQHYTVIAGNVLASLQLSALTDQNVPAPNNEISVRILDQSVANGALDVYFVPTSGKLTTTAPLVQAVVFGGNTGYINIPAGTYQIAVLPAGTVPIATTITSYTGSSVTYASGSAQTFILDDKQIVTNPTVNVITLADYPEE